MSGQYFSLKIVIGVLYLLSSMGTAYWVYATWPRSDENDIGASSNAVPGAYGGRTIIVVKNDGQLAWNNAEFTLNDAYYYRTSNVKPGDQLSVPLEDFLYLYAVPRNWDSQPWRDLSSKTHRPNQSAVNEVPQTLKVKTDMGEAEMSFEQR